VKAMEAVKILEVQPRGTPRRKRARNVSDGGGGNWGGPPRPEHPANWCGKACLITGVNREVDRVPGGSRRRS
jgi:hypothetical protein